MIIVLDSGDLPLGQLELGSRQLVQKGFFLECEAKDNCHLGKLTQNDLQQFYSKLKVSGRLIRVEHYGPGLSDRMVRAFQPTPFKYRKRGTGCLYQINDHLWEGKYSPRDAHGKRISRNVYAKTREECEEKLAAMIEEMKQEIAAEKEKLKTKI